MSDFHADRPRGSIHSKLLRSHLTVAVIGWAVLGLAALVLLRVRNDTVQLAALRGPLVEAARSTEAGVQRSFALLGGWTRLGDPNARRLLERVWSKEIRPRYVEVERLTLLAATSDQDLRILERLGPLLNELENSQHVVLDVVEREGAGVEQARAHLAQTTVPIGTGVTERLAALADHQAEEMRLEAAIAEKVANVSLGLVGLLIAASAIVTSLLSRRFAESLSLPIRTLARSADKLAEGRCEVDVPIRSNDELGDLSRSFNRMRHAITRSETELRKRSDQLESQIKERRRVEEELESISVEVLRAARELEDFAWIAAQDLKQPLEGLRVAVRDLKRSAVGRLSPDDIARIEPLVEMTNRLEARIDTLLHYARVGNAELVRVETDPNEIVEEIRESSKALLDELGVQLVAEELPSVSFDHGGMTEVLRNLVENGARFNDKSERLVEVGVESSAEVQPPPDFGPDEEMPEQVFYVRDNGIGFDPDEANAVFKIFTRLHREGEFAKGTGAGLAIAKRIVERHGGRIWADSTPGEGTTVFFTVG